MLHQLGFNQLGFIQLGFIQLGFIQLGFNQLGFICSFRASNVMPEKYLAPAGTTGSTGSAD